MINKILLSCFKATELIERRESKGLSTMERLQLQLHLSICDKCKKYNIESKLIDKALKGMHNSENENLELLKLQETIKKKLKSKE